MVLIHGTNILVDEFSTGRRNPYQHFVYFLTHCHSDHMTGLNPSWDYGTIYCSSITKRILQSKFPNIKQVVALELNKDYQIPLNESESLCVKVTLLDANHCLGSVMVLFEGYMGTILHTGDLRFTEQMIESSPALYPAYLKNAENWKCSIHIDELILDNTYCDPIFKFPSRKDAFDLIVKIISENQEGTDRVLIAIDNLGKEEMLIELSSMFQTLIVVNETRYTTLQAIGLYIEKFTTNPDEGFIEVIRKPQIEEKLIKYPNAIAITATGWINQPIVRCKNPRSYIVSYSLHSNFKEIETFVRSIQPSKISPLERVRTATNKLEELVDQGAFALRKLKQKGLEKLVEAYTDIETQSKEYRSLLDQDHWNKVMQELGFDMQNNKTSPHEQKKLLNRPRPYDYRNSGKKFKLGAKIHAVETNPSLTEQEKRYIQIINSHSMEEEEVSFAKPPSLLLGQSKGKSFDEVKEAESSSSKYQRDDYEKRMIYEFSQTVSQYEKPFNTLPPTSTLNALSQAIEKRQMYPEYFQNHLDEEEEDDPFRMMARAEHMFHKDSSIPLTDIEEVADDLPREEYRSHVLEEIQTVDEKPAKKRISSKRMKQEEKARGSKRSKKEQAKTREKSPTEPKSNSKKTASTTKGKGQKTIESYFGKPRIVTADSPMIQVQKRQEPNSSELLSNNFRVKSVLGDRM